MAQPALSLGGMNNLSIPLPELEEQQSIIDRIAIKVGGIDLLISKTSKMVELSQERRTALISAAVTGKIDVRHAA